jgi:phosphoribosylformimino-5-aminoimidazole carboxamide ribotide isomerase
MIVIPAIDLQDGRCVRLYQGDFTTTTVYGEDPVAMARHWESQGARILHVVDLDGAEHGEPRNLAVVERIARAIHIPVELGGGLRRIEDIEAVLESGVGRAILGTAAIEDPDLLTAALDRFGSPKIVVSLDARDGLVATHGWQKLSNVPAVDLARKLISLGVARFVYTDISRDGTLTSPNFEAMAELISRIDVPVIASGGVTRGSDLVRLAQIGAEAAIVGKSLYSGDLQLESGFEILIEE